MKKRNILIITIISLIITFVFAELFSIYHFGTLPTLLTTIYLISFFSIFEYILLTLFYIIKNKKIKTKEIIGRVLLFIALILILGFIIVIDFDWLNWYAYSSQFYINVIVRSIEFLLPATILIITGIHLLRKYR